MGPPGSEKLHESTASRPEILTAATDIERNVHALPVGPIRSRIVVKFRSPGPIMEASTVWVELRNRDDETSLPSSNFELHNDRPYCAAVATEAHAAVEAVDVVFVLDNSRSMRNSDPYYLTRTAVANFASALADDPEIDGRIAVILFDGKARLVRGSTEINAGETDALLRDALAELDFSGQRTNSPAGIERALYEFRQNGPDNARRAIVFLTDGEIDTGDAQSDLDAARWLREDLASESEASGIRIFGVPGEMETARDYYVETFGGFTRLLSEQLHADSFRTDLCEILSVLTCGLTDSAWVSLSIVPDDGQDPRIDLLSYEFLTEEELEEIEPSEQTDLSQSGLR